jgi:hypothetical protein
MNTISWPRFEQKTFKYQRTNLLLYDESWPAQEGMKLSLVGEAQHAPMSEARDFFFSQTLTPALPRTVEIYNYDRKY